MVIACKLPRNWLASNAASVRAGSNSIHSSVCASLSLVLHITNGDSITGTFRQVRFPGTYLAWNDVLHDGPVPQTGSLSELSDVRAQALASFGWGDYEELRAGFA